jgi:hypothetical protein
MTVATEGTPLAYSPAGAAKAIGCSRSWLYERFADGTLPSRKIAGKTFVRREDLLAFIDSVPPAYSQTQAA